jgi:ribosome biogenesis GTPase
LNKEFQTELKQRLATLNGRERKELTQRAANLRAHAQRRNSGPEARWTIEQFVLHELRKADPVAETGLIIAATGTRVRVMVGSEERQLRLHHTLKNIVPGDEIRLDQDPVREVLPRRTFLSRPDPDKPDELAIVANVEKVVIVVSAVSPPLHPRLIDRYLAAIWKAKALPVVVLNKVDLHESAESLEADRQLLSPYRDMGIPVFEVSACGHSGIENLREELQGSLAVFVGHSGVGKSSLLNALVPEAAAVTGSVSEGNARGAHTTRTSTLVQRDGLRIIDTPGVRAFGVEFRSPAEVSDCFQEFPRGCRFSDCKHLHEEECAVLQGVQNGTVSRARYDSYRRLMADAFPESCHPPDPGFTCRNCGAEVSGAGGGTKHRNHCPLCLHSVHLDVVPGDRLAACSGVMDPVSVWVRKDGEWAVIHRCRKCGQLSSNRIAADDNELLLMSLAVKPLSRPPFPLDRLAVA